jgi:hypothetical protein
MIGECCCLPVSTIFPDFPCVDRIHFHFRFSLAIFELTIKTGKYEINQTYYSSGLFICSLLLCNPGHSAGKQQGEGTFKGPGRQEF